MWPNQKSADSLRGTPGVEEFSGNNMRDILAEVREAFGRDAIILTQETVHGRIHVLATRDDNQQILSSRQYQPERTLMGPVPEALPSGLFARRDGRRNPIPRTGPAEASRLKALGFEPRLIDLAGKGNPAVSLAERVLALALGDNQDFTGSGMDAPLAGAYRFTGPTGHGKTSLIGKLATAFVLEHGSRGVVLASTDRHRFGSTLLLERMAELIGVAFHVIDETDIPALLSRRPNLLLVDTEGGLSTGAGIPPIAEVIDVLVVAATAEPELLARALHAASRDVQVALTQLDLTVSPGRALSLIWNERPHGKVLDWISYGQHVDGSHAPASVGTLLPYVEADSR